MASSCAWCRKFDVFVENYGPGVVERLDIGYDKLKAANAGLIYARIKGFGVTGRYSGFRSMDMVAQAAAGAFSITGEADGPPMMPGPTTGDSGTGVQAAMSILAAYIQRLRSGEGQEIELSMQEAMAYYVRTRAYIGSAWGTKATPRSGNAGGLPPCEHLPLQAVRPQRLHLSDAREPRPLGRPVRGHRPRRPIDRRTLRQHQRPHRKRCDVV